MKAFFLITVALSSHFAQAQTKSLDCSTSALAAVKGVLISTGAFQKRHLDRWSDAKIISSTAISQIVGVTYSAGDASDDYVYYKATADTSSGNCELIKGIELIGEE